jgi:class I fructose-bisphosphate aldolase
MREKAVVAAIDHGLSWGAYEGFEDPERTLRTILEAEPDGILAGVPFFRRYEDLLDSYPDIDRIATLDQLHDSTLPGESEGAEIHHQLFTPTEAAAVGADGAKVALVYGREDPDVLAENLRFTAQIASECRSLGVPLVVEPTLWGQRIEDEFDGEMLEDAARVAFEIGGEVIKSPYPGRAKFEPIVENSPQPVYIAGGPTAETDREVLEMVAGASETGARGVMFGRNIWQRDEPAAVVDALKRIVHDGASVAEAMDALEGA